MIVELEYELPDEWLELLLEDAVEVYLHELDRQGVDDAQGADELACEVVADLDLDPDSGDYNDIMAELCDQAGQAFPGDWEDYD